MVGGGGGGAKSFLSLSLSTTLLSHRLSFPKHFPLIRPPRLSRPLCSSSSSAVELAGAVQPLKHSILLERLRLRHLKDSSAVPHPSAGKRRAPAAGGARERGGDGVNKKKVEFESFEELGLSEEVLGAVKEMGIEVPTEIQGVGIPAVLEGKSVVLGSHTGSGKTLAYLLPLVQLMRRDEEMYGMLMKPRRPRAVVMCPTRELSEQEPKERPFWKT